ncbi:hypothetical protein LINPERHAP2_LOCUS41316, partial [Linum perenne]
SNSWRPHDGTKPTKVVELGVKPSLSISIKSSSEMKSCPFLEYPQIKAFQDTSSLSGI